MSVTEFTVAGPSEGPYGVAIAKGEVWTTLVHAGVVAQLSGSRLDLEAPGSRPSVIVPGPDDLLWFTRSGDNRIGRSDGVSFEVPGSPYGICVGPDGAAWFTLMDTDHVGRVTVDCDVETFPIGTTGAFPAMITADDELWFTLNQGNAIGRMTTTGDVTTYPLPTEAAGPVGISAGAEAVWFVEILADQAGRIRPDGTIEEFALPAGSKPHAVVTTDDGGCWITLWGAAAVARLDAAGNLIEQIGLGEGSEPHGLALDVDGSVWVALEKGSVAHIQP
ncbi:MULTISPECIES: Vgb family protein [unclassified Kribbella]|uniref:Vgb family protein n=1 Tax=unclassified Kribbella TaxID=2644121 RepID=UPI00301A47AE